MVPITALDERSQDEPRLSQPDHLRGAAGALHDPQGEPCVLGSPGNRTSCQIRPSSMRWVALPGHRRLSVRRASAWPSWDITQRGSRPAASTRLANVRRSLWGVTFAAAASSPPERASRSRAQHTLRGVDCERCSRCACHPIPSPTLTLFGAENVKSKPATRTELAELLVAHRPLG
jgi:hypothetical protein